MADTAIGIFLENLERLISCSTLDFIMRSKEKLQSLHVELVFLRDFHENSAEKQDQNPKVKSLVMRIRDLAHKAETIVDWFTVESFMDKDRIVACEFDHQLGKIRDEIGSIKIELGMHEVEIPKDVAGSSGGGSSRQVNVAKLKGQMHEVELPKDVARSSSGVSSRQVNVAKLNGKMVVGFEGEATRIIQELDDWQQRHLVIISIVGAGGAGKTTLASKVYHDRLIQERFDIRGWIVVSQVYDKKDLLISILKSTSLIEDGDFDLKYDELGEKLHRRLRDKKYLVVIDDIWSVEAWTDIQRSFPDDGRGSRVLFTTRMLEVGKIAQHHHDLLPLSPGDSWDLLQTQVFGEKISCLSELVQTGMEVAEKCGGLPLAIVVIAGILKETLALPWWKQVARSLSSMIAENDEVCMNTLALSYNHLPLHLKACLLYLGAFPEDYEIPVWKLILLWIAEGFVKQSGEKTLEDIAKGYLMELAGRSLVMVARKSSGGGIKACRIHDLLRELCMRIADEEYFFWHFRKADGEEKSKHRRLCCIKIELQKIYVKRMHEVEILKDVAGSSSGGSSRQVNVAKLKGEMVVGFDDEATRIIQELDDCNQRDLSIISIVGSPGAGKTTLASKVYHDRLIQECFAIRGWIVVSQVYDKKDLLISILKSTSLYDIKKDRDLNCDKLGEQLHIRLRDKKYLIVIDDIWSVETWTDIQRSFPDDGRGSRVLFTTRLLEVGKIAQHHHDLHPLSHGDSWELLQRQVFGELNCPLELVQTGMEVAENCRGLPLVIVVIAGILKETLALPWWKQVALSLCAIIAGNDEVCMPMLALSYNHLPLHLKACFLYLGTFPEDYEIPVRKLILLWIAVGFVEQSGEKILEAIAEGYLMDLVGRSLVMVARKGSGGEIKTCHIHDLLRELCTRIADEESFFLLHLANREGKSNLNIANTVPNLRTFLHLNKSTGGCSFWCSVDCNLNLLSVLDLSGKYLSLFCATEVVNFVHLRYLAISAQTIHLPPLISNLWNLETLILYTSTGTVNLPEMGNTTRLRHILVGERIHFENPNKPFSSWDNLQTLDRLCPCEGCLTFLKTTRNLKKLGISWDSKSPVRDGCLMFRDALFSEQLEELKLCFSYSIVRDSIRWDQVLPLSIRKLNLHKLLLHWEDMTILGQLPCLEVLKLLHLSAKGIRVWETNVGEFCQLRYLELDYVALSEWNSCADHFPNLETLVLKNLRDEITVLPSDFADLTSLEKIVVTDCGSAVDDFARQVKEKHQEYHGDYRLQVIIEHYW